MFSNNKHGSKNMTTSSNNYMSTTVTLIPHNKTLHACRSIVHFLGMKK
jgi:hypothetical protein